MANEFKHKDPGSELTQAEFIASDGTGHIFDSQAAGDILYAFSTTVLKNLAKATDGNVLELASGLPAWTASPTIGSTSWANANHAHAASNSGGTLNTSALGAGTLAVGRGGTGITSLGTNVATFLGTPSSANLRSALTDKTGTGSAVFATSPTLVTPALGTPASGVLTNASGTASSLTAGTVTTNANLTGVVTSSGNATSIADKALAIAKIADGTDGELITWNASGVIAAVAVGSADEVLTSNGSGAAPTFQAAAGGGKGVLWEQVHAVSGTATLSGEMNDYAMSQIGTTGAGAADGKALFSTRIPSDYAALFKAEIVYVADGTGNMRWSVTTDFATNGEHKQANQDSISTTTEGTTGADLADIDVSAALTDIAANDTVGFNWVRVGTDGADNLVGVYVLGLLLEYTT
jgi:hypothetical protein